MKAKILGKNGNGDAPMEYKSNPNVFKISKILTENIENLKSRLTDCPDLVLKSVILTNNKKGVFVFLKDIVDIDLLMRDMVNPILNMDGKELFKKEKFKNLPVSQLLFIDNIGSIITDVFSGCAVFMMDDMDIALSCTIDKYLTRSNEEPQTEKNIKGAHDGFIESLDSNISILRARIVNSKLKFKISKIGVVSNQRVAVGYIDGITNKEIVEKIMNKINSINIDGMIAIGTLEQYLSDFPYSPFPEFLNAERPDRVVAALLEGQLVVMLDGTPVTIIAPVSIFSFFTAVDDYSFDWSFSSFMRTIRIIAGFIALFFPAMYIAILSFHYEMIPLSILISVVESRTKVPFPPIVEAFIMEIVIELLRESAVRLPTYVGASVGVVGGIIIGQAAVQAGVVSNLMIIVVAVTAIASFAIPSHAMSSTFRVLRFVVMLSSAAFGIIGVIVSMVMIFSNLLVLKSLDQPYFQPLIPFKVKDMPNFIIRLPIKYQEKRSSLAKPQDKIRGKDDE